MKISRQVEAFAYRFAAEAPGLGGGTSTEFYSDDIWQDRVEDINRVLRGFYENEQLDTTKMPQYAVKHPQTGKHVGYTPGRMRQQEELLRDFLLGHRANGKMVKSFDQIPAERKALLTGGLSGSGKTTILKDPRTGIDLDSFFTLNVDDLKELAAERGMVPSEEHYPQLAPLSPMERTPLIHFEMQQLIDRVAEQLHERGTNLIYDYTMAREGAVEKSLRDLKSKGYGVGGVFVDIGLDEALQRSLKRHREGEEEYAQKKGYGGRPVPDYTMQAQQSLDPKYKSQNAMVFDLFSGKPGAFDLGWIKYDNSFDPAHVDMSDPKNQGPDGPKFSTPRLLGISNSGLFRSKVATFRRLAGEPYVFTPRDPHSIRGLLEMFAQGYIEFSDLAAGIMEHYLHEEACEEQSWADRWLEAEGPADDNDAIWIDHAIALGRLSQEQADQIFMLIGKAVMNKDSVGADVAMPGAGAAAPDAAPAPTLDKQGAWLWWR